MAKKRLYNVGALLAGLGVTFKYMFQKKPTIQYPSRKKKHAPRFHGLHELRRKETGKGAASAASSARACAPPTRLPSWVRKIPPTTGARPENATPRAMK